MQGAILASTLIPSNPSESEMFMFSVLGFSVVVLVLVAISFATGIIGKIFATADKLEESGSKKNEIKNASPLNGAKGADKIPQDHAFVIGAAVASVMPELGDDSALIAVIAAAASEILDGEVRIVSLKPVDFSYSRQGRMETFSAKNYVPRPAR